MEEKSVAKDMAEQVREDRVRRLAQRQGYFLQKSRRRDTRALDFGNYWLVDANIGANVLGGDYGTSLNDVEDFLINRPFPDQPAIAKLPPATISSKPGEQ